MPATSERGTSWGRRARRWGPFVVVVILVVAVVAVFRGGSGNDVPGGGELVTDREALARSGPMTPLRAELEGMALEEIDWGPTCDPDTERIKLPTVYAPPCVEPHRGDNGGSTSMGITEDTIKLILYIPKEDMFTTMISGQGAEFDPEDTIQAAEDLVSLFNQMFETYGRQVELEVFRATGASSDLAQAQADAIAIAEKEPFAVLGGPFLGNVGDAPFVDELAARGVVCLPGCTGFGLGLTQEFIEERSPYAWPDGMTAEQAGRLAGEAIGAMAGSGPAELAGDPQLRGQERVFGIAYPEAEASHKMKDALDAGLAEHGAGIATEVTTSLDVSAAQEEARTQIVQLKNAGVTTVIVTGAPFTPMLLTHEATKQGYHPEWILGPNYFADTRLFSLLADQDQWVHGFGLGYKLTANATGVQAAGVYEWAYGEDAVVIPNSMPYIEPSLRILFTGIHLAGPELTPYSFRDGLFRFPASGDGVTTAALSWGDHGIWSEVDYGDADDVMAIWWDPEAVNPDEDAGPEVRGPGLYRLANGGQRYSVGQFPTAEAAGLFDDESSVVMYGQPLPPEIEALFEQYEPPDLPGRGS